MSIQNLQISNPERGKIGINFDYPVRPEGFDHAIVAIVEQDGSRDIWSLRPQLRWVAGSGANILTTTQLRLYNESAGAFIVSPANTAGLIDDHGFRHYIIDLNLHRSGNRVSLEFPFGYQVDPGGTLEFYGIVGIVSVVRNDIPVALLGQLHISETLTGVRIP
jgi:hypothetical protein